MQQLIFTVCVIISQPASANDGAIRGIVANGSKHRAPAGGAEVVLQIQQDGVFVPIAKTTTDARGLFCFEELPVGEQYLYLAGASQDGVNFPGERVRLDLERTQATVQLVVYDSVGDPSPLVARRHELILRPEPGVLNVTETILVVNPTSYCYVGDTAEGKQPVTLRLGIASNFEKVTFHKEFFGRHFVLIDGRLLTNIPWPPGERELTFSYYLPITQERQVWERPLDLPCSDLSMRVISARPEEISCNLAAVARADGEVMFNHKGTALPAGHVIRLELGRSSALPLANAHWVALALLVGLILTATVALSLRRGFSLRRNASANSSSQRRPTARPRRWHKYPPATTAR